MFKCKKTAALSTSSSGSMVDVRLMVVVFG